MPEQRPQADGHVQGLTTAEINLILKWLPWGSNQLIDPTERARVRALKAKLKEART